MADSYHIIDGKVVPYCGGRKCNDTDAWRDATQLELQLQEQLEEHERTIAALQDEVERLVWAIEGLQAEVERVTCELMDAITRADKLAEALEMCLEMEERPKVIELAKAALAALEQEANDEA